MHASSGNPTLGELDLRFMKRYVQFARLKCAPRISSSAATKLSNFYVSMRSTIKNFERDSHERSSIPITVRQLEAIIRIAESIAKVSLSAAALDNHVEEALNLFKVATMQAILSGHNSTQ